MPRETGDKMTATLNANRPHSKLQLSAGHRTRPLGLFVCNCQLSAPTDREARKMLLPAPLSQYVRSLQSLNRKWTSHAQSRQDDGQSPLSSRLMDVLLRTWDLGFTAFGGPPVHFQILYARFVEGKGGNEKWVDEQTVFEPQPARHGVSCERPAF